MILNLVSTLDAAMYYLWLLRGKQAALFHFLVHQGQQVLYLAEQRKLAQWGYYLHRILQCTRDLNRGEHAKGH